LFQQFLNLASSQPKMSGPILGDLSNNKWSVVTVKLICWWCGRKSSAPWSWTFGHMIQSLGHCYVCINLTGWRGSVRVGLRQTQTMRASTAGRRVCIATLMLLGRGIPERHPRCATSSEISRSPVLNRKAAALLCQKVRFDKTLQDGGRPSFEERRLMEITGTKRQCQINRIHAVESWGFCYVNSWPQLRPLS
jgi:hypothetical protein